MNQRRLDLVTVGSAAVDHIHRISVLPKRDAGVAVLERKVGPGGVETNVAAAAARLGLKTGIICRVGADADGLMIRDDLRERGVDTSRVQIGGENDTAYTLAFVDGQGERIMMTGGVGVRGLILSDDDDAYIRRARACFTSGFLPWPLLERVAALCSATGGPMLAFDLPGEFDDLEARGLYRHNVNAFLPGIDLFMASRDSLRSYTGETSLEGGMAWLHAKGVRKVAVSDGSQGVHLLDGREHACAVHHVPAFPVAAVDTTGAGDVLHAALIASWLLEDWPTVDAGRFSAAAAALSCRDWGVRAALPDWDAAQRLANEARQPVASRTMRATSHGQLSTRGDLMPDVGNRERLHAHILGSVAAAALGDAMGAATEQHAIPEILEEHGGLLRELIAPSSDTFSGGNLPGQITDDTSQMFAMAEALIEANGDLTEKAWLQKLLHWSQTSPMARMMGPTTRPLLEAIAAGEDTSHIGRVGTSTRKLTSFGTTNGAAMRIAPAGLVFPGDMEGAVRLAWLTSRPTHDTQIAASGAGAIAAGVAHALEAGADVFSVAQACLWGARRGEEIGAAEGRVVAGPNVTRRIEIAIEEALRARDLEDAIRRIEASVGNSVMTVESVPAAVGIFVAAGGDPLETVVGGTNIGNDSDTIAAMAGSLAGALRGIAAVPADLFATVKAVNTEDIESLADGLTAIAWRRVEASRAS